MSPARTRWPAISSLAFALLSTKVVGQNGACGTANTNGQCAIGAYPQSGSTVYYSPDDSSDLQFYAQAEGPCDSGSYGDVTFYSGGYPGTFIVDCGCLPLDGSVHVLDCGIPRNSLPDGTYNFQIDLGPNEAVDQFSITHTQQTSTAPTPTSTVTSYTTETDTATDTVTDTETATYPQSTVTSPAGTVSQTVMTTASQGTTTETLTKTYTEYRYKWIVIDKTTIKTLPCQTPAPCSRVPKHRHERLIARQAGYSITGDGPLTTTVTPDPVIVTETDDGGTITETDTVVATTTTTVEPTPLTATVYSGSATNIATSTVTPTSSTVTTYTTTHKTVTKTWKIYFTQTKTTRYPCTTNKH